MTGLAQELTDTIARMEKSDLTEFQRGVVYGFKEILRSHFVQEGDPALIELIRQAEWACFIESAADDCCPWCKAARGRGTAESHEHTCPVAPILYPKEQA